MRAGCACVLVLAMGCSDESGESTGLPTDVGQGACGDVVDFDLVITGTVLQDGQPALGASVFMEESIWTQGKTWGSAISDDDGSFRLEALGLVAVEDCWGTVIDYTLTAALGQGEDTQDMNSLLAGAFRDSKAELALYYPLELELAGATP